MKYLKQFENFKIPYITEEEVQYLISKLRKIFDILGFNIIFTSDTYTNSYNNDYNDDPVQYSFRYYKFKFELNVNKIPYSISNILTRDIVPKDFSDKFKFISDAYPESAYENGQNNNLVKEISLYISKEKINSFNKFINAKDAEEAFNFIIRNFINLMSHNIIDKITTGFSKTTDIPDFSENIIAYLNSNSNYNSEITIPNIILDKLIIEINKLSNSLNVYDTIKIKLPFIYDKLLIYNSNISTAGKLGEIGF